MSTMSTVFKRKKKTMDKGCTLHRKKVTASVDRNWLTGGRRRTGFRLLILPALISVSAYPNQISN